MYIHINFISYTYDNIMLITKILYDISYYYNMTNVLSYNHIVL